MTSITPFRPRKVATAHECKTSWLIRELATGRGEIDVGDFEQFDVRVSHAPRL